MEQEGENYAKESTKKNSDDNLVYYRYHFLILYVLPIIITNKNHI